MESEETSQVLTASLDYLLNQPGRLGTALGAVGFSLGGFWALGLGDQVAAIVTFYGTTSPERVLAQADVLGHFAEQDEFEPSEQVSQFEEAIRSSGRQVSFFLYPGTRHWFFEENRPEYDAEAARLSQHALAWTPLERPLRPGIPSILFDHLSHPLLASLSLPVAIAILYGIWWVIATFMLNIGGLMFAVFFILLNTGAIWLASWFLKQHVNSVAYLSLRVDGNFPECVSILYLNVCSFPRMCDIFPQTNGCLLAHCSGFRSVRNPRMPTERARAWREAIYFLLDVVGAARGVIS
jgi:hypothetical protein